MARGKLPGNARCLRPTICLRLFVGWTRSVRLGIEAASVDKWEGRGPPLVKLTASSGSARLAIEGTERHVWNCAKVSLQSHALWQRTSFHQHVPCSDSTASMGPGRCSPMWLALLL